MALAQTRWPLFGALFIGALVLAIFWWLALAEPEGEAVPATGGTYREGVLRPPERINPLFAYANPTDADLCALIFAGLIRLGPDGLPQPALAARWEITNNGQQYVLHLRRGLAWQDGDPFDADDVLFTYRAIADPAFRGDPALAQLMQDVIVSSRDPFTVVFELPQSYAPFLAHLETGVLPSHLLGELDAGQLLNASFNVAPVGLGPYRLASRDDAGDVRLEPNPTYYLGPPHVATLEFRVYDTSVDLTAALRDGDVDAAVLPHDSDVSPFRDDASMAVHDIPSAPYFMLFLDTRNPLFALRDVRRALFQGLDRTATLTAVTGGTASLAVTGIPEGSWAQSSAETPPFNPGAAATALELAGFFRGRDGTRSNAENLRLAFTILTDDDQRAIDAAHNIAQQWRVLGITVEVESVDRTTFVSERLAARQYVAALALVDPGPDPDPYPFWHSSQVLPPGLNFAGFTDNRIDDAIERARQTTDTERRRDLYGLFDGYFIAEMPSIPLFAPALTYVQTREVQGYEPQLIYAPSARFAQVHEWYMRTRNR